MERDSPQQAFPWELVQAGTAISPGALKGPLRKPWDIKPFCRRSFLSTSSCSRRDAGSAKTLPAEPVGPLSSANQPELLSLAARLLLQGAGGGRTRQGCAGCRPRGRVAACAAGCGQGFLRRLPHAPPPRPGPGAGRGTGGHGPIGLRVPVPCSFASPWGCLSQPPPPHSAIAAPSCLEPPAPPRHRARGSAVPARAESAHSPQQPAKKAGLDGELCGSCSGGSSHAGGHGETRLSLPAPGLAPVLLSAGASSGSSGPRFASHTLAGRSRHDRLCRARSRLRRAGWAGHGFLEGAEEGGKTIAYSLGFLVQATQCHKRPFAGEAVAAKPQPTLPGCGTLGWGIPG